MAREFQIGIDGLCAPAGSHICHYGPRSSSERIAAQVLAAGLAARERCIFNADEDCALPVLQRLKIAKIDFQGAIQRGELVRLNGEKNGMSLLGSIVAHLHNPPATGVRLVGFPSWCHPNWPAPKDFIAFEALLEQIAPAYDAIYFCLFDHTVLPEQAMWPHPKLILGKKVMDNPQYLPPGAMRQHLRSSAEA